MSFTVTIQTENAAFQDNEATETARILRHIADRLDRGVTAGNAMDLNGNAVGRFVLDAEFYENDDADDDEEPANA